MRTFSQYIRVIVVLGLFQVSLLHTTGWDNFVDSVKCSPELTAKDVGKPMALLSLGLLTLYAGKSICEACKAYQMHYIPLRSGFAGEKSVESVETAFRPSKVAQERDIEIANEKAKDPSYHLKKANQKSIEAFVYVLAAVGSYSILKQLG